MCDYIYCEGRDEFSAVLPGHAEVPLRTCRGFAWDIISKPLGFLINFLYVDNLFDGLFCVLLQSNYNNEILNWHSNSQFHFGLGSTWTIFHSAIFDLSRYSSVIFDLSQLFLDLWSFHYASAIQPLIHTFAIWKSSVIFLENPPQKRRVDVIWTRATWTPSQCGNTRPPSPPGLFNIYIR